MLGRRRLIHHISDLKKPQPIGYEGRVALGHLNREMLESKRKEKEKAKKKNWSKKKKRTPRKK